MACNLVWTTEKQMVENAVAEQPIGKAFTSKEIMHMIGGKRSPTSREVSAILKSMPNIQSVSSGNSRFKVWSRVE